MKEQDSGISSVKFWLWLSVAGMLLAIAGNIIALSIKSIYAGLTPSFFPQALAQDIANLAVVSPLWVTLIFLAYRGSLRALLLWLGLLIFTIYNYVIYTFSVPFGPLFLLWVAVLGISLYSLIGGVTAIDHETVKAAFINRRMVLIVAWFLIVVAILFGFLWLSQDVPALLSHTQPQSLTDMGIPTNPVHVLDLAFFLPAVIVTGILLIQKKPLGYTLACSFILFLILTGIPILLTPLVQQAHDQNAAWGAATPIGILTVLLTLLLLWFLSTIHPLGGKTN